MGNIAQNRADAVERLERPMNPIKLEPIDLTSIPDPPELPELPDLPEGFAGNRIPTVHLNRVRIPPKENDIVNIDSDADSIVTDAED